MASPRASRLTPIARHLALGLAPVIVCCSYDFGRTWQRDAGGGERDGPADMRRPDLIRPDVSRDGLLADSRPPDIISPDVTPPPVAPPELCFTGSLNVSSVSCPSGWSALTGASVCNGTPLVSNNASANDRWGATCQGNSSPLFVQAICVRGAGFRFATATGGGIAVATCAPSEVVMGGGCTCAGGRLRTDDYAPTVEGWRCACEAGQAAARVACVGASAAQKLGRGLKRRTGLSGGNLIASCGKRAVAGGCDSEHLIVGGGVASQGLDFWKCDFSATPAKATVTAICLSLLHDCP